MLGQRRCQLGARHSRLAHQQLDGRCAEQVGVGDLSVVGVEPGVFVARSADELWCRGVVGAVPDPLHSQAGAGHHPDRDLGEFGQLVHGQGARRDHPVGGRVVDDSPVGADRYGRESQLLDDRWDPARWSAGGQNEGGPPRDGRQHRFAGSDSDPLGGIEKRPVHIGGDQSGQHQWEAPPSRWSRRAARSASSAASSSAACAGVGAPPPSRCGTQNSPGG